MQQRNVSGENFCINLVQTIFFNPNQSKKSFEVAEKSDVKVRWKLLKFRSSLATSHVSISSSWAKYS